MSRARYLLAAALVSCTPPSEPVEPPSPRPKPAPLADYGADWVGFEVPGDEVCKTNADGSLAFPVAPGSYQGILRNVRCRQQKFLTMAWMAETLGVACNHCHVPDPEDPKKEIYELWTDNKRTANWMYRTFVQGLRAVDGSRVACESCHQRRDTKEPVLRILGEPRDEAFAQEWMHEVMASQFVAADGARLKCRTCHVGMAPGTEGWRGRVIRTFRRHEGRFERQSLEADPAELTKAAPETDDEASAPDDEERQ